MSGTHSRRGEPVESSGEIPPVKNVSFDSQLKELVGKCRNVVAPWQITSGRRVFQIYTVAFSSLSLALWFYSQDFLTFRCSFPYSRFSEPIFGLSVPEASETCTMYMFIANQRQTKRSQPNTPAGVYVTLVVKTY